MNTVGVFIKKERRKVLNELSRNLQNILGVIDMLHFTKIFNKMKNIIIN